LSKKSRLRSRFTGGVWFPDLLQACTMFRGASLDAVKGDACRDACARELEHFPTKWKPVRRRKRGKINDLEHCLIAT
jgi:hypothetical protein